MMASAAAVDEEDNGEGTRQEARERSEMTREGWMTDEMAG